MSQQQKIQTANSVLEIIALRTTIAIAPSGHAVVNWSYNDGRQFSRRWMTRGQDFYPTWHRHWGHGGTCTTALSQLVRWVQCKPILSLNTWRWWTGRQVAMGGSRGEEIINLLSQGGYPESVRCVLCDCILEGSIDWWSLKGVSGPCCASHNGCRQKSTQP